MAMPEVQNPRLLLKFDQKLDVEANCDDKQ